MQRIVEAGVVAVPSLELVVHDDVPANFAAVGSGQQADGTRLLVSFAPRFAGDALLAGLATAARLSEEEGGFDGEVVAVAPQWSTAARRRLGLASVGDLGFRVRGAEVASLGDGTLGVLPETQPSRLVLSIPSVAARLANATDRALFLRAAAALEGLASKHGGAVRGCGASVELVILARRVAELRAVDGRLELNTILPQRSSTTLSGDDLAEALDRLEGHLRKRLNDRRTRDGEEGLRARAIPLLAGAKGLRAVAAWPLGGADEDAIDLVGVDASGEVVVGAIREQFNLAALGAVIDAMLLIEPMLPTVLAGVEAPVRIGVPRLALAANGFAAGALRVLGTLGLAYDAFEIRAPRGRGIEVAPLGSGRAPEAQRSDRRPEPSREPRADSGGERDREQDAGGEEPRRAENGEGRGRRRRSRRGRPDRGEDGPRREDAREVEARADDDVETPNDEEAPRSRRRRSGGRSRGGRGRGGSSDRPRGEESAAEASGDGEARDNGPRGAAAPRFDAFSSFDLDDDSPSEGGGGRPRRQGRSRRRGRRGGGAGASEEGASESDSKRPELEAGAEESLSEDDDDQLTGLADLPDEVDIVIDEPTYDEEEDLGDDSDAAEHAARLERERRRRARKAKEEPEAPKPPRRRAVILAHADRDSLISAIVLARDVRLLEGMWVYPQSDLMTFFRSVTTDLREGTPIYVIGFTPSPARDVLQAAGLYSDRIVWFDHHDWPPEDADAMRQLIGAEQLHLSPGAGSSLPGVLSTCTRRSRFTDKLVDLATGRFTLHDYERWGRLWSSRLASIAQKSGEVRSDIEPLLAGRPSDLAREAARVPAPDLPPELEYVSRRDFRLVHFGGYTLVVAELDPNLDVHLASRIARERHGATLSLSYRRGDDAMVLAGDELAGNRSLDLGSVVEHLNSKHQWVDAQSDDDHVARFRIRGLADHPERLDDVIGTIAMGRSILER